LTESSFYWQREVTEYISHTTYAIQYGRFNLKGVARVSV